jgi:signal transduction histidine kinase
MKLERSLGSLETWGFGLSGLLLWLGTAPAMHAALGAQALWVWVPATLVGMLLNLQVKHLGTQFPDITGGTPSYITRLLQDFPGLARYSALGYWMGWVSIPPMNAIILADLIQSQFAAVGVDCPVKLLQISFTLLPFIVAATGLRAMGILHTFFVLPAVGVILLFCGQGLGWLMLSPTSPGLGPQDWGSINWVDWLKWFYIAVYAAYGGETASCFVAESRRPTTTLQCLKLMAGLLPVVYIGGSWVLTQLATDPRAADSAFLNLVAASTPFWGAWAQAGVAFLIVSGCLLSSATAIAICPRVLYQLASDRYLAPVWGVVSRQGAFPPGLLLTLAISLMCLFWGNTTQVVFVTGTGYLLSMMALHGGMWLRRGQPESLWPWWSLLFFTVEAVVLGVGGWHWGLRDLLLGMLFPLLVVLIDAVVQRVSLPIFQPQWWLQRDRATDKAYFKDFVALQVVVLVGVVCLATSTGWWAGQFAMALNQGVILVVLLLSLSFVAVAIACWTVLPQILAVDQARAEAEQFSLVLEDRVAERTQALESLNAQLQQQTRDLEQTLAQLHTTQAQMVQGEKMSALGNLVAGVAHEINNPIGFLMGSITNAKDYLQDLLSHLQLYQRHYPTAAPAIVDHAEEIDLDFLADDFQSLLESMQSASFRIKNISTSLRTFSRADTEYPVSANIHDGIDSTILILKYRLKANEQRPAIAVITHYGDFPSIECFPGQLNQVFMNLLANAIDMFDEVAKTQSFAEIEANPQQITIHTEATAEQVSIRIQDNGTGMDEATQARVFEHLFTTKPVGKGTGLGLAIAKQIIEEKHSGRLEVNSQMGVGTTFLICLPTQAG